MKNFLVVVCILLVTACGSLKQQPKNHGVVVYTNGNIVTMNETQPEAEAVAIKDGKILGLGTFEEVEKTAGNGYQKVDLNGKTLMPGFIDSHVHPFLSAVLFSWADVSGFSHPTKEDVWNALKEEVKAKKPGEWVFAFGWDPMLIAGLGVPHVKELDEIAPDNPLFILQQNMHTGYVNSRAYEIVGVTKDSPEPGRGGFYDKGDNGELTGKLIEIPSLLPFLPYGLPDLKDPDATREFLKEQLDDYSKMGVTSIVSMGLYSPNYEMLEIFERIGNEDPAVRNFVFVPENLTKLMPKETHKGSGNEYFRYKGIKYWYDGSPYTESMLLNDEYLHNEFTQDLGFPKGQKGHANWKAENLIESMTPFHKENWQIATHTQGDKASEEMFYVMEKVITSEPREDHRHRLEHCVLIDKEAYKDFGRLGIAPSFHIHHLYWYGKILRDYLIGQERSENMLALNTALKAGHKITIHSDRPMYRSTPLHLIETAVNRKTKEGDVIGADEAIPVEDAIKAMTINAAWQVFEENNIGSLAAGKFADMIILSENPLDVKPEDISKIHVLATIINGRKVYENINPKVSLLDHREDRLSSAGITDKSVTRFGGNCACSEMIALMNGAYKMKEAM